MSSVVEVTWIDHDGEETNDLYGPFTKPEKAAAFAEAIEAKIEAVPRENPDHLVLVAVRHLRRPVQRPIIAEVRAFYAEDEDEEPDHFHTGTNSADHATMR